MILLETKIQRPHLSAHLVSRDRLTDPLEQSRARKLILVSAPAGFGKTTLIAEWLHTSEGPYAWFSIDEKDNDFARFFLYVTASVKRVWPDLPDRVQTLLQASVPVEPETCIEAFIDDLTTCPVSLSLILEDYHAITTSTIHVAINFLLDHLPPHLRLVMITRADPSFSISRLRAQGQVLEIRADDLRFSAEETTTFFQDVMHLDVPPQTLERIGSRIEGWIATWQLAALSMQEASSFEHFEKSFDGTQRYVVDYLVDEVLAGLPEVIQKAILYMAIPDRFCTSLCNTLVDDKQMGNDLLDYLDRHNLFLIALDEHREWYRFHHLFRDFLLQRLQVRYPNEIPLLHQWASRWFKAHHFVEEAIQHALQAQDFEQAANLVQEAAHDLITRNEIPTLVRWVEQLPDKMLSERPILCIGYAWALFFLLQFDRVEPLLARAEEARALHSRYPVSAQGNTIRAFIASSHNDHETAITLNRLSLAQLDGMDEVQAANSRGVATLSLANACLFSGMLDEAEYNYEQAARLNRQTDNNLAYCYTLGCWAKKRMMEGRLHSALDLLTPAFDAIQTTDRQQQARTAAYVPLRLSEITYEQNHPDRVEGYCRTMIESVDAGISPESGLMGYGMMALLKQATGELDASCHWLKQADRLLERLVHMPSNSLFTAQTLLMKVRLLLARKAVHLQFFLDDVNRWLISEHIDPLGQLTIMAEPAWTIMALLKHTQGRHEASLAILERLVQSAEKDQRQGDLISHLTYQAIVYNAMRRTRPAAAALSMAIQKAEPEGYIRTFVDAGPVILKLLQTQDVRPSSYHTRLITSFSDHSQATASSALVTPPRTAISSATAYHNLIEPLKERELEVLHHLRGPLTKNEIAHEMFLSENTIRWYVKQIYLKLDVNSRRKAVDRAGSLGLLTT